MKPLELFAKGIWPVLVVSLYYSFHYVLYYKYKWLAQIDSAVFISLTCLCFIFSFSVYRRTSHAVFAFRRVRTLATVFLSGGTISFLMFLPQHTLENCIEEGGYVFESEGISPATDYYCYDKEGNVVYELQYFFKKTKPE